MTVQAQSRRRIAAGQTRFGQLGGIDSNLSRWECLPSFKDVHTSRYETSVVHVIDDRGPAGNARKRALVNRKIGPDVGVTDATPITVCVSGTA